MLVLDRRLTEERIQTRHAMQKCESGIRALSVEVCSQNISSKICPHILCCLVASTMESRDAPRPRGGLWQRQARRAAAEGIQSKLARYLVFSVGYALDLTSSLYLSV